MSYGGGGYGGGGGPYRGMPGESFGASGYGGGFGTSAGGMQRRQAGFGHGMQQQQTHHNMDIDHEVGVLQEGVDQLKQMSMAIGQEAKEQGRIVDALEATLERAKLAMQQGMRRLNRAYQQSKSWHMLYLVLFALGAFIFVLFFSRLIGIVRFIFCIPSVIFGYCKHKST